MAQEDKAESPEQTGEKREYEVGHCKPPKEHQFKPGNPGGGRPKKTLLTDAFEQMLEEKLSDPKERARFIDAFWKKLLSKTVVSAMTLEKILERTEGKVSLPVQVTGDLTVSLAEEMRKAGERVARMEAEWAEEESGGK